MPNTCGFCDQEYLQGSTCTLETATIEHIEYYRIAYEPDYKSEGNCHDCGIAWGGLHHASCDMDDCPRCLGQAMACGCRWDTDPPENEENPGARRVEHDTIEP